ncbi:hypothetical protein QUA71_26810 [Microcoleus sp. MON1_C5]|uniref:hypothetical protein n=1 Tax=Microcoleus sp. MON1_C5 TaxID=2818828 RepID=UPI002FCE92E4
MVDWLGRRVSLWEDTRINLGRNSENYAVCDRTTLDSTISGIHQTDDFLSAILKRDYSFYQVLSRDIR